MPNLGLALEYLLDWGKGMRFMSHSILDLIIPPFLCGSSQMNLLFQSGYAKGICPLSPIKKVVGVISIITSLASHIGCVFKRILCECGYSPRRCCFVVFSEPGTDDGNFLKCVY